MRSLVLPVRAVASRRKDLDSFPEPNAAPPPCRAHRRECWTSSVFFPRRDTPEQRVKKLQLARYKRIVVVMLKRIDEIESDLALPHFSDESDVSTDY